MQKNRKTQGAGRLRGRPVEATTNSENSILRGDVAQFEIRSISQLNGFGSNNCGPFTKALN